MATTIPFGQYQLSPSEFFYQSRSGLSCALVNSKPISPGHVLVIPKRVAERFSDLLPEEIADLWISAARVGAIVQEYVAASACTYAIQDGRDAGQTVRHVHVHIVPRQSGDFDHDKIYGHLGESDNRADGTRTPAAMAAEADLFRGLFDNEERL